MQDEVTKHTRKIFSVMKNAKQSFSGKIKEITIEILIIVFAVTVSIWLHSWSQHEHQQKEVKEFLTDVKDDLKDNIRIMTDATKDLSVIVANYDYLEKLDKKKYDSIVKYSQGDAVLDKKMSVNINIRKFTDANYEGFKSSGKIGFIENKKLKKLLLAYYQKEIPALIDIDEYYNLRLARVIDYYIEEANKSSKELLFDSKFRMHVSMIHNTAEGSKASYESVIKSAKKILAEIDKELQE